MKRNLVVTLADENFVSQAKQLFSSVYWNAGWDGDYLLLAHQIPETELTWFRDKGIIVFNCNPLAQGTIGFHKHPSAVLDKFYLFTTYFKQWEKIIFLDADIIVRHSIDSLLCTSGFSAPNATSLSFKKEFINVPYSLFNKLRNQYPMSGKAFNTGVFSFNTHSITDETFKDIFSLYTEFGQLNKYGEEGTLNIFFYKRWNLLPIIYNTYPITMECIYGLHYPNVRATIIHFVASIKPWNKESPYHSEWMTNLIKAEAISHFSHHISSAQPWSESEKNMYMYKLFIRKYVYFSYLFLFRLIDRNIGRLGILLKKISPSLYGRITKK